ncbi:MAG: hypothetical protein GXY58_14295 [Planctomycetaceae bacterium]|nr:hypothetical protein [Planctomycetaceae bacterium]
MSRQQHPIFQLLKRDTRYKLEAYQFVRDALSYAHEELGMGQPAQASEADDPQPEAHLTGQQLCEAIRIYAIEQFGLMSRVVLNNWGISCTGDFGEIVYNLIGIGLMKKSETDQREDFDNVYSFDEAFDRHFKITRAE